MATITITVSNAALAHAQAALELLNTKRAANKEDPLSMKKYVLFILHNDVRERLRNGRRAIDAAEGRAADAGIDSDFGRV